MKTTTKKSLAAAVLCLAMLSATSVGAATVQVKEAGLAQGLASNGLLLPIQNSPTNYWTGMQNILVDTSNLLQAFCIDPWEWSSNGDQPYSASGNFLLYFGAKSGRIRELYADAYASTQLPAASGGNLNAAAFQLALWEIIGDADLNFASGVVQTVAATNPLIVGAARTLLDHLGDGLYNNVSYTFELYSNGRSMGAGTVNGFQDYLVAYRVPEPASGVLLLLALAIGAGSLRATTKRRDKAS